ncbi:hypothetical protein QFC22_003734 [Naganishia vaughanmartiniae]|uniref:Uncharacterized protein n=1 Tax=Naganishia vaughanmartiniae TaxID=1424756 RepID=A0ACC2X5Q8_9TREE|nr:hypothetical protein QFC22_003734 [Naganishia vaughanmartiniae]
MRRGRLAAPGQTDILDDEPNNNGVDPYTYQDGRSPQMSQYASQGGYPASATGTAPSLAPLMATGGAMPPSRNGSYSEASQSAAGGGGAQGITRGPSTASTLTSSGFAGRGAQVPAGQMPYSAYYQAASGAGSYANASSASVAMPLPAPAPTQPLTGAQQKAREAAQERPVLRTANPSSSDDYYAPASASGVYVHSDNGRYVPEGDGEEEVDDGPSELPPQ